MVLSVLFTAWDNHFLEYLVPGMWYKLPSFNALSAALFVCVFFSHTVRYTRRHPAQLLIVSVPVLQSKRNASSVVTKLLIRLTRDTTMLCSKQSRQCSALSSYWVRQARHTHLACGERKNNRKKQRTEENMYCCTCLALPR